MPELLREMEAVVDATTETCVSMRGLTKRFGGFYALRNLSLDVQTGHIHAVIGPNGAGKTTLFNLITGVLPADSGQVRFRDQELLGMRPSHRTALGVSRTFQNIRLFGHMSVLENVMLGAHYRTFHSLWTAFRKAVMHLPFARSPEERRMREEAMELLAFVGLKERAHQKATDLPYGQRRLLEVARALATEPRLLLLDEPAAGMNTHETEELDQLITRVQERGVTIILVEHDMNLVMGISDRVSVLNFGEKIAEGTPAEVQGDPSVIEAYLGEEESL